VLLDNRYAQIRLMKTQVREAGYGLTVAVKLKKAGAFTR
jgi:hypothetical protein